MTDFAFDSEINAPARDRLDTGTLRARMRRSLFPWLTDAVMDWLVIAAALAMIQLWPHFYTVLAGILVIGNRQHALAILGHDGTHYTLSRNAASQRFPDQPVLLLAARPDRQRLPRASLCASQEHRHGERSRTRPQAHARPQWDLPATPWTVLRYALKDLIGYSLADYCIIVRFSKPQSKREYLPLALFHIAALSLLLASAAGRWPPPGISAS